MKFLICLRNHRVPAQFQKLCLFLLRFWSFLRNHMVPEWFLILSINTCIRIPQRKTFLLWNPFVTRLLTPGEECGCGASCLQWWWGLCHSLATGTCTPPSLSSTWNKAGRNMIQTSRKTFLKHPAIYWSGRSRYLAFPRCWFIKQHLIHLHVQAIVDRRGAVRLRVRWRRRGAAVSMVTAPVTTVRHLATSAVCPVWCYKQNSGVNFLKLLVKEVTPGTWRSANLELVLHEWGFGSLGCMTDWSAP